MTWKKNKQNTSNDRFVEQNKKKSIAYDRWHGGGGGGTRVLATPNVYTYNIISTCIMGR